MYSLSCRITYWTGHLSPPGQTPPLEINLLFSSLEQTSHEKSAANFNQHAHSERFVARYNTLSIPWPVLIGQCILITSTYVVDLTTCNGRKLILPKSLFPPIHEPDEATTGFRSYFVINAPSKLASMISVSVTGTTFFPSTKAPTLVISGAESPAVASSLLGSPTMFELSFSENSLTPTGDYSIQFHPDYHSYNDNIQLHVMREDNNSVLTNPADTNALTVQIAPMFTPEQQMKPNAEILFVISVGNGATVTDIASIREALEISLRGLPVSCNVNAVCCRSNVPEDDLWMFPVGSERYSFPLEDDILIAGGSACIFLNRITFFSHSALVPSDNQTTSFHDVAMKRPQVLIREIISSAPCIEGMSRNIVLITTDGGDKCALETVQMARANTHSTSVSTISLNLRGSPTADVGFLEELAKSSNGIYACADPTSIPCTLVDVVSQLAVPSLTHCSILFQDDKNKSEDGSPCSTIRVCGHLGSAVPLIRGNRTNPFSCPKTSSSRPNNEKRESCHPVLIHAFGDSSLETMSIVVRGLIGIQLVEYLYISPMSIIDLADKNTCVKGDASSISLPHIACAKKRIDQIIEAGQRTQNQNELTRIALAFGLPSPTTSFICRGPKGAMQDNMLLALYAEPSYRYNIGRVEALSPADQKSAISCVLPTITPTSNVAACNQTQRFLVSVDESKVAALKAEMETQYKKRRLIEKAQCLTDDTQVIEAMEHEQQQINGLYSKLQTDLLPYDVSCGNTKQYFMRLVQQIIDIVCTKRSISDILTSQRVDGSFCAKDTNLVMLLGMGYDYIQRSCPQEIASDGSVDDWATLLAVSLMRRASNNDTHLMHLALLKAEGYLSERMRGRVPMLLDVAERTLIG